MEIFKFVILMLFAYFMGNVSVARIITAVKNQDITTTGSGNPGTMNMLRNHGAILGFVTLICDAIKAAIPAIIGAFWLFPANAWLSQVALYGAGFAAVIGHMYPVFYAFKGGKGIACTVGVFMVANPLLALAIFVVDFVFFYFVKIGSLASMFFILLFAGINTFISDVQFNFVAMILMWVIVVIDVFAHRVNFIRLFANEERLTSFKESVKKDIQKVQERKSEKLDELIDKEQELNEHFEEKLEKELVKEQEKILSKKEKSIKKVKKKQVKLQQRYNRQIHEMKKESEEIINYMQKKIDKKNSKGQKSKRKQND